MNKEFEERMLDKLEPVGTLHPKAGMTYALQYVSRLARLGFGMSRREVTKATGEASPFIHSFRTFDRYMGVCKEFVRFCRMRGVNRLHKLYYDTVECFLMEKVQRGLTRNTIETNMCALKKFLNDANRGDLRDQLDQDYGRFKYLAKEGDTIHAFDRPEKLIEKIGKWNGLSAVIAKLEQMTGVRIHELRSMQITDGSIVIPKGKGGKRRALDFSYRPDELREIRDLAGRLADLSKGIDWQRYCQEKDSPYQGHVKAACRSLGDAYVGAHGFRANYSQELRKKLEDKGFTPEEIELIITRELGHERRSMARHYLRA